MKKYFPWMVGSCLILLGIVILLAIYSPDLIEPNHSEKPKSQNEAEKHSDPVKEETKDWPVEESVASFVAVGDILIHDSIYKDALQKDGTYNFNSMFSPIKPYIENADLAIANSETMIGGAQLGLSGYPTFNSPKEVGDALKYTGFDVVSMATNHTLDRGRQVIKNAINHWQDLDIVQTGAFQSFEDQKIIRTKRVNDIQFGFLSYTYGTNGIPVPKGQEFLVNLIDRNKIEIEVEAAKKISDVVVVSLHFGNEYERMPNEEQKSLVQFLADLGVHIVIGTHPHVLQPADFVTGKNGNHTFVIYSAGNFISAQVGLERLLGGIFGADIRKISKGPEVTIQIENPKFLPTYTYYNRFKSFKVYPLHEVPLSALNNRQQIYKDITSHVQALLKEDLNIIK